MKANVTITKRGVITQPVEMYTPKRVREFEKAERKLAAFIAPKSSARKRAARSNRKAAR